MSIPQPKLVVIAERKGPTRSFHRLLRLIQASPQLACVATGNGGKQLSGEYEIEGSMQFIVREIGGCLLDGLDGLTQQKHIATMGIHPRTQAFEKGMGFR